MEDRARDITKLQMRYEQKPKELKDLQTEILNLEKEFAEFIKKDWTEEEIQKAKLKESEYNNCIKTLKKQPMIMNNKQLDLRTPLQRQRDERNQDIYKIYIEYMNNLPKEASKWSVFRILAEQFGMQPQGIRSIIKKMEQSEN